MAFSVSQTAPLSPYHLGRAREQYTLFNVFNALSWSFLIGNVITLFAMRLDFSATELGILNALIYVAFFFLPLGKVLTKRFSIIHIFSVAWIGRAIGMIPLLFIPILFDAGYHSFTKYLLLIGVLLFHAARGIGMVGNNPVLSAMATGPDRGSYMTQIQAINSAVGMFCGFVIALALGDEPSPWIYAVLMAIGIGTGIASGILMRGLPEPPSESCGESVDLLTLMKNALTDASMRYFIVILFIVALVSGVSRAFIIVYSKDPLVFQQGAGMVSLYSVFGGLGVLVIQLLIKFLIDRIGAKPIFIVCSIIGLVGMLPVVFTPVGLTLGAENPGVEVVLLLSFLFFILNFGFLGAEGIAQTYFLNLVPAKMMLDMGILYFFIFGVAGVLGSFLAGLFLDVLVALGFSKFIAFKALYIILIALTIVVVFLQRKLVSLGALPFRNAIEVIFSFRDLRAISLLDRLHKTKDSEEEEEILEALRDTPSSLAIKELLERAKSPRLAIRLESLLAIEALETLNQDAEQALIADIVNHPYTTAYLAARILGTHSAASAIPLLRQKAFADDYMLAGEAIVALAKLGDKDFRPEIERLIINTKNPRLELMGVAAFGIYASPDSLSILVDLLRGADPPPYLRDEVVLAMASILDIENQFYPLLVRFLDNESLAPMLALDEAESAHGFYRSTHNSWFQKRRPELAECGAAAKALQSAVSAWIQAGDGAPLSRWILELPGNLTEPMVQCIMAEIVLDTELASMERLHLLIVHWSAHILRVWITRLKTQRVKEAAPEHQP
ncbi:MAG: MFS transporter [Treponema sp.]|jgi:MFS family permease|nr:MFS transporter [Treponema sp.]